MTGTRTSFQVSLSFEKAQLPPFNDILILGRKCPVGISGITKSMEYLIPNGYEVVELDDPTVEAVVVNKAITKRLPMGKILGVLRENVFPLMGETEIIRVDFTVRVSYEGTVAPDLEG